MPNDYSHKKVLVADDTAFLRSSIVKDLVEIGFGKENILECENGKMAFDFLQNHSENFDLILSDWNMPKINGLEFLKLVRGSKQYFNSIPFILITTVSEKEKIVEALKYQVSSYIIKPVVQKKLQETIDRIFTT